MNLMALHVTVLLLLGSALRVAPAPRDEIHLDDTYGWDPRMVSLPRIMQRFYKTARPLNKYRCMPIGSDLCKRFGYNESYFPNPLNHQSEEEAVAALTGTLGYSFQLASQCSSELPFLLCSYHMPPCSAGLSHPIYPCRSVCKRVKRACEPLLKKHGLKWPSSMQCGDLPKRTDMSAIRPVVCLKTPPDLTPGRPFFEQAPRLPPPIRPTPQDKCPHAKRKKCNRGSLPIKKSTFCRHQFAWVFDGMIGLNYTAHTNHCFPVKVYKTLFAAKSNLSVPENGHVTVCTDTPRHCPQCLRPPHHRRLILAGTARAGEVQFPHRMALPTVIFQVHRGGRTTKRIKKWTKKCYRQRKHRQSQSNGESTSHNNVANTSTLP